MATATRTGTSVARTQWAVVCLLAGVAIVARLGALLVHRHLSLDDGAYGVSVVDMRHGLLPYRDLFSSQGPLHYPLLYAGDLLGLRTRNAPRVVPVLSGVVATIGVWAAARRLGSSPRVALVAGLLVATTGSMLWTTGPVSADGPAVAFTVCAVWAALSFRDSPSFARVILVGVLFGAALATKPLMFPAVIPVAWWCWSRRRPADLVAAGITAAAVWLAAALPWGLSRVWDQSIRFHLDKSRQSSPLTQLGKLLSTLIGRDLLLAVAVALGIIAAFVLGRRTANVSQRDIGLIEVWAVVVVVVLVFQTLLLVSHVAMLVPPLALLFAVRPPPSRWLAASLVVLVPVQAYLLADILVPRGYSGPAAEVEAALRALPPGALAISDIPGLVWQAGRHTPPLLNDNSNARIETGRETTQTVLAGATARDTCAVVIWSFRFAERLPGLREGLERSGYVLARDWAPAQQLWLKPVCRPNRATAGAAPA